MSQIADLIQSTADVLFVLMVALDRYGVRGGIMIGGQLPAVSAPIGEFLRHVAPVFHGDTLYGESAVVAKRLSESRPGTGIVTVDTRGRNQDGAAVCEFRRSFLVPERSAR